MAHGLMNVLRTAERLTDKKIFFLFVGAGAERDELIAYASSKQLTNVKFLPTQPKRSMPPFWSICDAALIHLKNDPVFAEVIPSKIFEAMGMGLPIILAAPAGEASAIVIKEKAGLWVTPENPSALAEAILILQNDTVQRETLAQQSRQAAVHYSRERQANDMLAVLSSVAEKNPLNAGVVR
jgi:colanic acid biosynthesis glycosyl transferase WcaI